MEKMLDCSNLLSECMESHLEQAQILLFSLPINPMEWSSTMDHCQSQQRYKRTPKKRGGSHPLVSGQSAKKGIFGKVGKFAVAGIAAYGTYKLAKTLTKGLRRGYDDDDCWEYSILR